MSISSFEYNSEVKARISVLVVDDDETVCESIASILRQRGYQVRVVGNGGEALELLKGNAGDFHIFWLDLFMTGASGRVLIDAALAKNPKMRIIVMTGRPDLESRFDVFSAGAWEYLPKPFNDTQVQLLTDHAAFLALVEPRAQ